MGSQNASGSEGVTDNRGCLQGSLRYIEEKLAFTINVLMLLTFFTMSKNYINISNPKKDFK